MIFYEFRYAKEVFKEVIETGNRKQETGSM
jgi:hypothetical protein